MNELYDGLPEHAKNDLDRLYRLRFGMGATFLMILAYPMFEAQKGVASFLRSITDIFYIVGFLVALLGVVVVIRRTMLVSAAVIATYELMAPDQAEEIVTVYGERGLGDIIAPWIRRRQGRIGQARTALFGGLMPWDRRRR